MAHPDTVMTVSVLSTGITGSDLGHRLAAVISQAAAAAERTRELREQTARVTARTAVLVQAMASTWVAISARQSLMTRREPPPRSEYAQMVARRQTMPVIEQAKGIIMAQSRCGPAEAFETLRRVSQRSNVP